MEDLGCSETLFSCAGGLVVLGWAFYTFWVVLKIHKAAFHILKSDWFLFPSKSGFYVGAGLGFLWALGVGTFYAFFPKLGLVPMLLAQIVFSFFVISGEKVPSLERLVWFSIPFFTLPFWFSYRQGQKDGSIPQA